MSNLIKRVQEGFKLEQTLAGVKLERDLQRDFIKELKEAHKQQRLHAEFFTSIISNIVGSYDNTWELPPRLQRNTFFEYKGKLSIVLYREHSSDYESYFIYNGKAFSVYKTENSLKIGKKKFESLEDLLLQDFTKIDWEDWK